MTLPAPAAAGEPGEVRAAEKIRLRRHYRSLRLAALAESQSLILAAAQRELPALVPAGQRLGLYWPLAGEPDLRPLARSGSLLALPAVGVDPEEPAKPGLPQAARLLYRPWQPGDPLAPDHCGIPAPLDHAQSTRPVAAVAPPSAELRPEALALLLVPALAIDRQGIRLGDGGGWYDRLRADAAWRAVPALAVLPAACVTEALPRDPWDVPFAGWLDERGLHRIRDGNIASL